jgi:SprT-like family
MLRALKRYLTRSADPAQLALPLDAPPPLRNGDDMLARLRKLGLRRIDRCRLTSNRNVMVSYRGGELRVHEGYLVAPESVLRAIVVFIEGRTRADRRAARRVIVEHPVRSTSRPTRRERTRPEDGRMAADLSRQHAELNARFFDSALRAIRVRISRRMKSRLGHYTAATPTEPAEIAISWRHVRRHGWTEALHTLLHEMVHQWQDEQGFAIDHGSSFRAKAREVGITPSARRRPCTSQQTRLEA